MNQAKINELYERAHVVYEIPYEGSVVDPTIVSVHKQRVFDRYLLAELIVRECISTVETAENGYQDYRNQIEDEMRNHCIRLIKNKFGIEE